MSVSLRNFSTVYYALVGVFMLTVLFELQTLHYAVKPLFMVLLMWFHRNQLSNSFETFSKLIQFGLFFSWIGDIALMFDEKMPILFVVGLGAFLVAHVGYFFAFINSIRKSENPFNLGKAVLIGIPFAAFTVPFFLFMKDGLPSDLFGPVLAYTVVITVMGIGSAIRLGHTDKKDYQWILIGAILFILSDCVIAINKFVHDFQFDAILNMALYLGGQYMITVGAVYYAQRKVN
jgi:uncharacterized membrane protein YhhN